MIAAVVELNLKRFKTFAVGAWACITLMSSFGLLSSSRLGAELYPAVKPLQRAFVVSDVSKANVSFDIEATRGDPLYHLQCHSAGYTGDPDFDYSGDFECRLSLIGQPNSYSTLLTEDAHQSKDWESRGRFFAAELQGPCGRIPEFGATRSFKLRNMDLTLGITDQKFMVGGKLSSLTLTVTVRIDPRAQRPIAEIVSLPKTGVPVGCGLRKYFVDYSSLAGNH